MVPKPDPACKGKTMLNGVYHLHGLNSQGNHRKDQNRYLMVGHVYKEKK